jgi:hypothetical protein
MFEMTTEKVFRADDKYVLRLLNVVIHEHQFKRKAKYYKSHFDTISIRSGGALGVACIDQNTVAVTSVSDKFIKLV